MKLILFFAIFLLVNGTSIDLLRKKEKSRTKNPYLNTFGPTYYLFFGLDARLLDIFKGPLDAFKFSSPIFTITAEENKWPKAWESMENLGKDFYQEFLTVLPWTGSSSEKTSSDISSQNEWLKTFSADVSIDGSALPVAFSSFSLSASYTRSRKLTLEEGKKYAFSIDVTRKYMAKLKRKDLADIADVGDDEAPSKTKVQFSKQFSDAAKALPDHYTQANKQTFANFFKKFGTHYMRKIILGCKTFIKAETETSNKVVQDDSSSKLTLKILGVGPSLGSTSSASGTTKVERTFDNTETIGSCDKESKDAELQPIKYKLGSILELVKRKFDKPSLIIPENDFCTMGKTPGKEYECSAANPIYAVTDLKVFEDAYPTFWDSPASPCETYYQDATPLTPLKENHKRIPTNQGNVRKPSYRFLCQKKENIVGITGEIKEFIYFAEVFPTAGEHGTSSSQCLQNLMLGYHSGQEAIPCFKKTRDLAAGPILDFGLYHNSIDINCPTNAVKTNKNPLINEVKYQAYTCMCNGLSGFLGDNKGYTGLCFSKSEKPKSR